MLLEIALMWEKIEHGTHVYAKNGELIEDGEMGLQEIALDRCLRGADLSHIRLFVATIVDGGRNRHFSYFKSESFLLHCRICGFNPDDILKMFQRLWTQEERARTLEN